MSDNDWIASLKVGDRVAIRNFTDYGISKIERETPTTWILTRGTKVRKSDGRITPRPSGWMGGYRVEQPTLDILEKVERRELESRINRWNVPPPSLDQLRRVCEILNEKTP